MTISLVITLSPISTSPPILSVLNRIPFGIPSALALSGQNFPLILGISMR